MEKLNSLARRILDRAMKMLPDNQSRYAEEWLSHYAELATPQGRLSHAIGCASCVFKTQTGLNGLPEPAGFRIEVPGFGAVESDLTSGLRMMVFLAMGETQRDSRFANAAQLGLPYFNATMHLMNEKESDRMDNYLASLQPRADGVLVEFYIEGFKYSHNELPHALEHYFGEGLKREK